MRTRLAVALVLCLSLVAAYGVIGSSAAFTSQATALQNVAVGVLGCSISSSNPDVQIVNTPTVHTATYTTPRIMASAPGSAPFPFTITSTGDIPVKVHVTQTVPAAPFTSLLADPVADVTLNPTDDTHDYAAGLAWTELSNANMGTTAAITYTVSCVETSMAFTDAVFPSTNAWNRAGTTPGHTGQWAYVDATPGPGTVTLTFHQPHAFYSCFEYRYDGNVPDQRTSPTNFNSDVTDGLWPYKCLNVAGSTATVTLGPTVQYVEVRLAFGAETDERFGWTRFDALP